MATYFDDFESDTVASPTVPTGWSQQFGSVDHFSIESYGDGKCVHALSYGSLDALSQDSATADANNDNSEVLGLYLCTSLAYATPHIVYLRGQGSAGSEKYYYAVINGAWLRIYRYDSGSNYYIASVTLATADSTWYWVRLRANGTSLSAALTAKASGAPASWDIDSATDSNISGTGHLGVIGNNKYGYWDQVGFGTNGDTAPDSAGGGGTTVDLSGISSTGNTGNLISTGAALELLNGLSVNGEIGSLNITGAASEFLSGLSASGDIGSLNITGAANLTLAAISATGLVGSLTIQTGNGITVNLSGNNSIGNTGSLSVTGAAALTLNGINSLGLVGNLSIGGGIIVSISGLQSTGLIGSLVTAVQTTINLAGLSGTGDIGILDITGGALITLSGILADGQYGTLAIDTGVTELNIPGYRTFSIEHEDRRYLILAEDRKSTIH